MYQLIEDFEYKGYTISVYAKFEQPFPGTFQVMVRQGNGYDEEADDWKESLYTQEFIDSLQDAQMIGESFIEGFICR